MTRIATVEDKRRELAWSGPRTKVFEVRTEAVQPTSAQIEQIRPYLLREFDIEDLYIRQMMLANDQVDRSFERFDRAYLKRFAETIAGKSVMIGHEYGAAPVGRFFDAKVAKQADWTWLKAWFYMPRSAGNELARDNIDSGVWSYVSIGAAVDWAGLTCDICSRAYLPWLAADQDAEEGYCPHIAGEPYDGVTCTLTWDSRRSDMGRVEAVEGSIVYLGCQYDAAISKSAHEQSDVTERKRKALADNEPQPAGAAEMEEAMDFEARAKELEAENERLKGEVAVNVKLSDEQKAETDKLRPLAADGETYASDLKAEIIRMATLIGEEKTAQYVTENVGDVAKLKEIRAEYEVRWDAKRGTAGRGEIPSGQEETKSVRQADSRAHSVI